MTALGTLINEPIENNAARPAGIILSVTLHAVVLVALLFSFRSGITTQIVAAGPGEGGEGGGGSIEVGVADASEILGFAKPQPVSFLGESDSPINNVRVETNRRDPDQADEVLPATERDASSLDAVKTDRPVASQHERIFTGKEERGRSATQSAQVGRSFGSPTPRMAGGVGIGSGSGLGGTGLPGGSEYGRRIQAILGRYYAPPPVESNETQYVIILIRIARDGKILSISNGRVSPAYIRRRSALAQVNYAAERAVIAADPLPPFPVGFLSGVQEAVAEVWFQYPK